MTHINAVGSLNMDLVVQVPILSIPGETVSGNNFAAFFYLSAASTIQEAAKIMIAQEGVKAVVTTLGRKGVSIVEDGQAEVLLPPFPVEVLNTTAAGDAFVAALAVGLEGLSLHKTCQLSNAVGALTVTKMGAEPSLPTRAEVNQFLENQEKQ